MELKLNLKAFAQKRKPLTKDNLLNAKKILQVM